MTRTLFGAAGLGSYYFVGYKIKNARFSLKTAVKEAKTRV